MKTKTLNVLSFSGLALTLSLSACGPAPTATPQPVTSLGVICEPQNIGQRRTVEGFFIYPDLLDGSDPLVLILGTGPGGVEPYVHVRVPVGTGANQVMAPPADASDLDLQVVTADGAIADLDAQVRVSGQVVEQSLADGSTCLLTEPVIGLTGVVNSVP